MRNATQRHVMVTNHDAGCHCRTGLFNLLSTSIMAADQINAPDILSSVAFTFTTTDVDKQSLTWTIMVAADPQSSLWFCHPGRRGLRFRFVLHAALPWHPPPHPPTRSLSAAASNQTELLWISTVCLSVHQYDWHVSWCGCDKADDWFWREGAGHVRLWFKFSGVLK